MNRHGAANLPKTQESRHLSTTPPDYRIPLHAQFRLLFAAEMEPDDLRTGLLFEVTDHRIANHLVQFFQGVGHGKYRLAQRFGGVAPLGPLTMKMISFMFDLPKTKTAGEPD